MDRPVCTLVLAALAADGVRVLFTEHEGVAAARNAGIAATKAPLILLLDADDLLDPMHVQKASAVFETGHVDFVSCQLRALASLSGLDFLRTLDCRGLAAASVHISTIFHRESGNRSVARSFPSPLTKMETSGSRRSHWATAGRSLTSSWCAIGFDPGSRYSAALHPETYHVSRRMIIEKHREQLAENGEDVFMSQLEFQSVLRGHRSACIRSGGG